MGSDIIYTILRDYGEIGIAIGVAVLVLFVAQIVLQLLVYGRIASFRLTNKKQIRETEPAISIIVPLFAEDYTYLDTSLVNLLTQDHNEFEVVLVYVGNNNDFFEDVKSLQRVYPHLNPVQICCSPFYPVSLKIALNVGIKSAKHDFILTTSSDATPTSNRWLSLLAKGFIYGDIVLGYSGIAHQGGFKNFIFRSYKFSNAMAWISAIIRRRPYSSSHNAFGFTKELYFNARGFNHLDMDYGVEDLFLQEIATPDNVSVVLAPRATCTERTWGGWRWWWFQARRDYSTHHFYKRWAMAFSKAELYVRFLFFLAIIAIVVLTPWSAWQIKATALGIALLRYFFALFVMVRNTRRLGEKGLIGLYFIYDFVEPVLRFFIAIVPYKNSSNRGN